MLIKANAGGDLCNSLRSSGWGVRRMSFILKQFCSLLGWAGGKDFEWSFRYLMIKVFTGWESKKSSSPQKRQTICLSCDSRLPRVVETFHQLLTFSLPGWSESGIYQNVNVSVYSTRAKFSAILGMNSELLWSPRHVSIRHKIFHHSRTSPHVTFDSFDLVKSCFLCFALVHDAIKSSSELFKIILVPGLKSLIACCTHKQKENFRARRDAGEEVEWRTFSRSIISRQVLHYLSTFYLVQQVLSWRYRRWNLS